MVKPVKLLSVNRLRRKLGGLSITKFQRLEPEMVARGMKVLKVGKQKMYLESSVDEVLLTAIENETEFLCNVKD